MAHAGPAAHIDPHEQPAKGSERERASAHRYPALEELTP